ncbi:cartilage intermediate layer protein 1-like [Ostrea edulis]|uniref:cartilage intermediate layer protein 1-like n=1 Tax=Ostrea edulis TaxID=37623 RepID=UPI0024AE9C02|nr:cartilage intermediate layer protein 1-like [Ostrea edulis]
MKALYLLFILVRLRGVSSYKECRDNYENCLVLDTRNCFGEEQSWMQENCEETCGICKNIRDECRDTVSTCADIPNLCTTPEYIGWTRKNCRQSCHLCDQNPWLPTTEPSLPPTKECVDKRDDCYWFDNSYCFGENHAWARDNCPRRCGMCGDVNLTCVDDITYCHKLDPKICTDPSYQSWARTNCRKFCNLCEVKTTTPPSTTHGYVTEPIATNPIDGGWTLWDTWSDCSATCNGGTRTRQRYCVNPPPQNGGRNCVGTVQESESCNPFTCPNCNRRCPWGGTLSDDCSTCKCSESAVFGFVKDENNHPISGVEVFLSSKQWEPFSTTNAFGEFSGDGNCLIGERLVFKHNGYSENTCDVYMMNDTHWQCDGNLQTLVSPKIKTNPEDKIRMKSQNVMLCCEAIGRPNPSKYVWFKDNVEVPGGEDGHLHLENLQSGHAGLYTCRTQTVAGSVISKPAKLTVEENCDDTCQGHVEEKYIDLPSGCYFNDNGKQNATLNVGQCRRGICLTRSMLNTETCRDPWERHCCVSKSTKTVDIQCQGFTYPINMISSCKCNKCVTLTQVSGTAYGIKGGQEIPFNQGELYINDKLVGVTSSTGFFNIRVDSNSTNIVVELKNDRDRKFMDTIKTIEIAEDENTQVNIIVPLKPKPIRFDTGMEMSVSLGSVESASPALQLSLPGNSIITSDGTPFNGHANASIHFMDPRSLEDLQSAYGSVSYIDDHGVDTPLDTYGMFDLKVEDDRGNELFVNAPITVEMDASLFNVTLDKDGNPDLYSWYLDHTSGRWVKQEQFKFKNSVSSGKRKLLQSSPILIGVFPRVNPINILETVTKTRIERRNRHNCDSPPLYYYTQVTYRDTQTRRDACVVRVKVYEDTLFNQPISSGATVVAYTWDKSARKYSGSYSKNVNKDGVACLKVFCRQDVFIHAKQSIDPINLVASNSHSLPFGFGYNNTNNSLIVQFHARDWGYDVTTKKLGPVFVYSKKTQCDWRDGKDDFHFQFAPLVKPPDYQLTISTDIVDNKLSWYPAEKDKMTRRACFIKVRVLGSNPLLRNVRIMAISYQRDSRAANIYGSVNVGPIPDLASSNIDYSTRAACVEFRCPGEVRDGPTIVHNVPTDVKVNLMYSASTCRLKLNPQFGIRGNVRPNRPSNPGFSFSPLPNDNYGPITGVYIGNGATETIRNFCLSGRDTDPISNTMKTTKETSAATFEC